LISSAKGKSSQQRRSIPILGILFWLNPTPSEQEAPADFFNTVATICDHLLHNASNNPSTTTVPHAKV
jgi:hypothetical protein